MESTKQKCSATATDNSNSRWPHIHPCHNKAKVERDGKPYCNVHDPEKIRLRDESKCHEYVFNRKCNQPAVEVLYGFGVCVIHTDAAKATRRRLGSSGGALLEAAKAVIERHPTESTSSIYNELIQQLRASVEKAQ